MICYSLIDISDRSLGRISIYWSHMTKYLCAINAYPIKALKTNKFRASTNMKFTDIRTCLKGIR